MRNILKLKAFLFAAALLALPATSYAAEEEVEVEQPSSNPWEFNVSIGPVNQNFSDPSYDLVSDNDWMTLGMVTFEFEVWNDLFVAPAYFFGSSSSRLNSRADVAFDLTGWELKVRKGFQVFSWLRPYAAATGSYNWYSLEIDRDTGSKLSQEDGFLDGHFGARGALGTELMIPRRLLADTWLGQLLGGFTLGLAVETGYSWRQAADWKLAADSPSGDAALIPRTQVDLGSMDLAGWYWTLDFRFLF
jgi:hypothetical protein